MSYRFLARSTGGPPVRARRLAAAAVALAFALPACNHDPEPAMEPTTTTADGPLVTTSFQMPAWVDGAFQLVYVGRNDQTASYLVSDTTDGTDGLDLAVGEERTVDGYRLRLVSVDDRLGNLAVTGPDGRRVGG
jgi:hypothetical protein